jgi:predicted transcriptional regulator
MSACLKCEQALKPTPYRKNTMSETIDRSELLALTADIVSAHLGNNAVNGGDVAGLIQSVFDTLNGLGAEKAAPAALTPAVPIKRSVTEDYIVCLEDGRKLKMLKRHLMTAYGMTPGEYRAKWGLNADYPMVAPNPSLKRQELAKKNGLGRKRRVVEAVPAPKMAARKPRAKKAAA